jgi:hypothetical protein
VAGPCASAVGIGGLLYGLLFAWIVWGAPDWVDEVWVALLLLGSLVTVPVIVALYQRLRGTDEGLALTALLLGLAAALGGAVHGGFNLSARINPESIGRNVSSPDPGGVFRYLTAGLALLLVGWLVVAGLRGPDAVAGLRGPNAMAGRQFPAGLGQLAVARGAVLVFIYIGRLYDFITPDSRLTLIPPLVYGIVLHPALYLWLGRLLGRPARPSGPPDPAASAQIAA